MMDYQEFYKGKMILVTGGAGFIGSNLVRLLLEQSCRVVVLDNLSSGYWQNLAYFSNVKFIKGDIRDAAIVDEAMKGVDIVFHLAASVGNLRSLGDPVLDSEVNVLGTLRLLECARKRKVKKFIYSSSAAIFGEPRYLPIDEDHPLQPDTPYGVSKLAGEKHTICYSKVYDMDTICLRYFNVYGPNQRYDAYGNVIPIFVARLLDRHPLLIYGDGDQTRDFVHVRDIACANLLAAQRDGVRGVFNIGGGTSTTINQLATIIQETAGIQVEVEYQPPRKGDARNSLSNISAARSVLKYEPQILLAEGIKEYLAWMQQDLAATKATAEALKCEC